MSQPLYSEVKRLAAMLEANHPSPPDVDLNDWIDRKLAELGPLNLRRQALFVVIESDYYGLLIEKALGHSAVI
ncbi:hypothetical protein GCM10011348_30280 [Marinobacterium nitratireducens]|uniref:Uncharacterized protein n=1 Tax=Marinobacterium nitratireducens TaxID=518897 RepID=A0A917ZLD9_9GAMM|nr:hypothetical protein [Marinobacterium nitratireducens]GGO84315.1 hypothetical protein GCM10011348_30280 [Marinobacterium nitratireducens]